MLMVIQTGTTSMTVKLNTLMAVPKTSLLTMMTELYTFRESKLKANTSLSTKKGQMQDGLQYCQADGGFYYFDNNGYQKTGRVTSVENDDDDYTFYFNTKNGKNGLGYNGLKDDYLYFNGKRLDADDDYRLYYYDGDIYLTNTKGKVQKTSKKYDIENKGIAEDDVKVEISGKKVVSVTLASGKTIKAEDLIADAEAQFGKDVVTEDQIVSVPFIQLYDDDIYTYTDLVGTKAVEGWLGLNK